MGLNILYIDDEPTLCELFVDLYSAEQVKIHSFSDYKQAIAMAQSISMDIAFIDLRMPGICGEKIAEALPKTVDCYLVTGDIDPTYTFNFRGVITKPFHEKEINTIIQKKLQQVA